MASELYNTIDAISREKGIDPQIVVSAVEDAIVVATRKYYKTQENLRAVLDKESGQIRAYAVKTIVERSGDAEDPLTQIALEDAQKIDRGCRSWRRSSYYKPTDVLGRIAAQMAKQVIFQKVREAERDTVFNEYINRVGEIVNATVKRVEGQDVSSTWARRKRACRSGSSRGWSRSRGRARARGDRARGEGVEGSAGGCLARGAGTGAEPVPDGSAGDLRQHGA